MVAGAIGVPSQNVLSHVAEVFRHDIGNATAQFLNMEEIIVRRTKMRHDLVILKHVQVGKHNTHVPLHIEILNNLFTLEHSVCMHLS